MGLSAGTAFVDVQPKIGAGFQGAIASKLGPIGLAGGAILATGIGAGIGGLAALKGIGDTFDEAFDTIRVGTGATGEDLAALQEDFKTVFASVPTSAEDAAVAIADLNTRTGATGETLQGLATNILELGRITGEDTGKLIETSTRLFGDWGVAIEDSEGALDALFRASQATGPPVSRLQELLVKYGAPLRQFGFGMEESAALLGKFEKEGVNTELVMGSMRVALGKIARAGGDPGEALQGTIQAIKDAGSAGEANALALDLFGARAGPDMAAAIREGRFELGELFDQVNTGGETILGAAAETSDYGEAWTKLKNQVFVALEPVATRFLELLGRLFTFIGEKAGPILAVVGDVVGSVFDLFTGLGDAATGAEDTMGGAVSGIGDLFASLGETFAVVGETVRVIFDGLKAFWDDWGGTITDIFQSAFDTVISVLTAAFDVVRGIFDVVLGILTGDWSRAWEGLKGIVGGVLNAVKAIIRNVLNQAIAVARGVMENFGGAIKTGIDRVVDFFKALPGRILRFLRELPSKLVQLGKDLIAGILKGLGNIAKALGDKLKAGISKAVDAVKGFFGIGSPSKVLARELGLPLAEGVALGAGPTARLTGRVLARGIEGAVDTARRALAVSAGNPVALFDPTTAAGVLAAFSDPRRAGAGVELPPIYADIYLDGIGKLAEGVRVYDRTWRR